MTGARDGDKAMCPLFPRLHVNGAVKRRYSAPRRNKMALYEQLSTPSQRFHSEAASTLPPPPQHAASLVPWAMSSQGYGHEPTVSSPYCVPPCIPVHEEENAQMHSMEGTNQNAMRMGVQRKSLKIGSQRLASTAGNVQVGVECSSLNQNDVSSIKDFSGKRSRDEDGFRAPICVQPVISLHSDKDHRSMDRERRTHFHLSSLQKNGATAFSSQNQVQGSHGKPFEWCSSNVLMTRQSEGNSEGQARKTVTQHERTEVSMSNPAIRENAAEPSNICKPSSNLEHPCCKLNEHGSSRCGSARICQESNGSFGDKRCLSNAEVIEKQVISSGKSRSCSKTSLDNISRTSLDNNLVEPSVLKYCSVVGKKVAEAEEDAERTRSPVDPEIGLTGDANKNGKPEDADGNDDASETSVVDSLPDEDISPDDVVRLISLKQFWKVRRTMAKQQRVLAVQIFELHRLIKVQNLISASPDMLLLDTSYLHCSPKAPGKDLSSPSLGNTQPKTVNQKNESYKLNNSENATEKTASADFLVKSQIQIVKQEDAPRKGDCNMACPTESRTGIVPVPREHCKGPVNQLPRDGASSGRVSSFPATPDSKEGARCFLPPGIQRLIRVMSPSEGLIYEPYAGPCPLTVTFTAPVYSGWDTLNAIPVDLMNPSFGVPRSHQQQNMVLPAAPAIPPSYFPAPHGLPVVNPVMSGSPVEQMTPMAGPQSSGRLEQRLWSSMSNPMSEPFSVEVHIPEHTDLHGTAGNCPGDQVDDAVRDALPLFPMTASAECSGCPPLAHCRDHGTCVIKVVPHNAKSAAESAARIFHYIQKERQEHDSV